jgi:uncharacterized protein (TIGR03067 family)
MSLNLRFFNQGEPMKALGLASFATALLVVLTAQGGDDAAQKKDKAALQGKWKIVGFETNKGKDMSLENAVMEFDKDGKNLTFTKKDDQAKKGTFKLNPGAKPKEIDIMPGDENKTFEGIYQLDKDKLKLCLAPEAGDGRPGEFALKDGKNYVLITMERVK